MISDTVIAWILHRFANSVATVMLAFRIEEWRERSFLLSRAIRVHGILHVRVVRSIPAVVGTYTVSRRRAGRFLVYRENEISFSNRAGCERSNMVTSRDALKATRTAGLFSTLSQIEVNKMIVHVLWKTYYTGHCETCPAVVEMWYGISGTAA